MRAAPLLAALVACASCRHSPPSAPAVRLVVGPPYAAGGVYRYPRSDFEYDATGLAVAIGPHGPMASDGAAFDPAALVGAHPTLQLPCIARVTNLDNGRQLLLRLDDRGPAQRGRILGLSRRAARLLGIAHEPTAVRVQVEAEPSRQLAASLPEDAPLALVAAPRATVRTEPLPDTRAGQEAPPERPPADGMLVSPPPPRLPAQVFVVPVRGYALFVLEAEFQRHEDAAMLARRTAGLGARVARASAPRDGRAWRVLLGPLRDVAAADATLDRAIAAGVVGASIVAE